MNFSPGASEPDCETPNLPQIYIICALIDVSYSDFQRSQSLQTPPHVDNLFQTANDHGSTNSTTIRATPQADHHIGPDKLDYLTRKGAFKMPPRPLQLALIRAYVNYVHPRVPFADIRALLRTISSKDQAPNMSILLFQSIFFAGSVFIGPAELHAAGYKSRAAANAKFFARARCLFDLDYEKDRLTVIKLLVLLSFSKEKHTDKDPQHWMSIAVSLAYTAGLHRYPDRKMPVESQRERARTWWILFCRDRILSLGTKRAGIIDDGAFETPILTLSEFEFAPFTPAETSTLGSFNIPQDLGFQKRLALIFIENIRLSLCVSRVLKALEFPRGLTADSFVDEPVLSRESGESSTLGGFYCIQELESWVATLPATIAQVPLSYSVSSEANKVLRSHYCAPRTLHLEALTLIYHSLEVQ
jgi:hypothetical protein